MSDFNIIVALLGGVTLVLGLGSAKLAASPLPPTLLALLIGIAVGPEALGWVDPERLGQRPDIMEKAARLTLGIGLVGVALRVPRTFPRRNWRAMLVLIAIGMLLMWALTTAIIYFVLGLPFWVAALIAAVLTPTDPVAASPIVTGRVAEENIPQPVRDTISFESGANDGLSYLFIFLPFLLLTKPLETALFDWATRTLLWEVGVATGFGLLLGFVAGKLLQAAERRGAMQREWRLIYTVALALLAVGAGKLIRSDEVLVVFAAGAMFTQVVGSDDRENEEQGQEAVNRFFAIPIFVLLGTALPWDGWLTLGWSGLAATVAVLAFRRLPVLLLLRPWLPNGGRLSDALFVGWFGPIAVAATYYAAMMEHRLSEPLIWDVVTLVICASVVAHGVTGAPLTRLYGRIAGLRAGQPTKQA